MERIKSPPCLSRWKCAETPPSGVENKPSTSPGHSPLHPLNSASRSNFTGGPAELGPGLYFPDTNGAHIPNLPPPPKVGEKLRPMEEYAPKHIAGVQGRHQHTKSSQMPPASPRPWSIGCPIEVSLTPTEEVTEISTRSRAKSLAERTREGSIEHPTGYVQNPYALEMSPEQRFAIEQEDQLEQTLPVPSCTPSRRPSTASSVVGERIEHLWNRTRSSALEWLESLSEPL